MKSSRLLGLALLASTPAFAISESSYLKDFDSLVMPFYESAGITGEISGVSGVQISYRKFELPHEKGAIVFAPGRGESYLTYPELEYDLVQAGYSVYVIDHRSQGFSGRIAKDRQVVTVENYGAYVADLKSFIDNVVNATPHEHRYLLTNSMGGPIGALYLAKNPATFERAVMSVPMFEIDTHGFPEPIALELSKLATFFGQGDQYAKLGGEGPYNFKNHSDCSSSDGYQLRHCRIEGLVLAHPESASGGSSYRWVYQSLNALRGIRNHAIAAEIGIPLLIFQAGKDRMVKPGGQDAFCEAAANCRKIVFASSGHGILTERDEIRAPAVNAIVEFFGQ